MQIAQIKRKSCNWSQVTINPVAWKKGCAWYHAQICNEVGVCAKFATYICHRLQLNFRVKFSSKHWCLFRYRRTWINGFSSGYFYLNITPPPPPPRFIFSLSSNTVNGEWWYMFNVYRSFPRIAWFYQCLIHVPVVQKLLNELWLKVTLSRCMLALLGSVWLSDLLVSISGNHFYIAD